MASKVVKNLFRSLDELEQSIAIARRVLAQQDPIPLEVMRRVANYEDILTKQRKLAKKLCNAMVEGKWDEVARYVKLINALSAMIQEDARSLMKGMVAEDEERAIVEKMALGQ